MASSATAASGGAAAPLAQPDAPAGFSVINEGKARVLYEEGQVFYNKAQVQNRDLSVAALRAFAKMWEKDQVAIQAKQKEGAARAAAAKAKREEQEREAGRKRDHDEIAQGKGDGAGAASKGEPFTIAPRTGMRILEALSASGLRSMRYALEIPKIETIIANDIVPKAVQSIQRNIDFNGIPKGLVVANQGDASMVCYENRVPSKRFDVVDLDPYGSPAIFLDGAIQSLQEGGLLCCTATDMAVLCGTHSAACHSKYGSISLRGKHCHEQGLRILLSCIQSHAGRHSRYIVPLLCVHMDFYVRVFVRVFTSPSIVKRAAANLSYLYQCSSCHSHALQPVGKVIENGNSIKHIPGTGPPVDMYCSNCGNTHQVGGPIWSAPYQDTEFIDAVKEELSDGDFAAKERLVAMLGVVRGEMKDVPLSYDISEMSNVLHCSCPTMLTVRSALAHAGYEDSTTHTNPNGIKTNAPSSVLWDILRAWVKEHPISKKRTSETSPGFKILAQEPKLVADLTPHPRIKAEINKRKAEKEKRFVPAPAGEKWGPLARAHPGRGYDGAAGDETGSVQRAMANKSKANQGKNQKKIPCREFGTEKGCKYGDACRYGHNEKAAKAAVSADAAAGSGGDDAMEEGQ